MPKNLFDTEQLANDYRRDHRLHQRVAERVSGTDKWALNFPLEAHVTVQDGAPSESREPQGI